MPPPVRRGLRRSYERYQGLRAEHDPLEFDDTGLPLPPKPLRRLVSAFDDTASWVRAGRTDARLIRDLAAGAGTPLENIGSMLDFACGCGRVARRWHDLEGSRVYGCDYNPELTDWCRDNLPFVTARTNGTAPPLPFESDSFDLIYALSLFTHLPEETQPRWMADVERVLAPGGLVIFTVHGDRFAPALDDDQRQAYDRGELVVRSPELAGTNACAVYHPPVYVGETLLPDAGLELVEAVYEDRSDGDFDLPVVPPMALQDNYLARKPAR